MKNNIAFLVLIPLYLIISFSSFAEENTKPKGTYINLKSFAEKRVQQDLLIGQLRFEHENKSASVLQEKLNEMIKSALKKSKKYDSVLVTTENYSVYKAQVIIDKSKKIPQKEIEYIWKGNAGLKLESEDKKALLKFAGSLQNMGFAMNSLNYSISRDKYEAIKDDLTEVAILKLQRKAKKISKLFNHDEYLFSDIFIDNNSYHPSKGQQVFLSRKSNTEADFTSPIAEPGMEFVRLNIRAKIFLKD
jgi:predicted secreted protein